MSQPVASSTPLGRLVVRNQPFICFGQARQTITLGVPFNSPTWDIVSGMAERNSANGGADVDEALGYMPAVGPVLDLYVYPDTAGTVMATIYTGTPSGNAFRVVEALVCPPGVVSETLHRIRGSFCFVQFATYSTGFVEWQATVRSE